MPLIPSPRHRGEDLEAWEDQLRYDHLLHKSITGKTTQAISTLNNFCREGLGYVGISWGKDSTVIAHMVAVAEHKLPLVWVRVRGWENPDCELVRDAFLGTFGECVSYDEIVVDATAPRRWESPTQGGQRTSKGGFDEAALRFGDRHVSGVRAQESTTRRLTVQRNGTSSAKTCRPIAHWSAQDVFTYLDRYDLPIHPAYAMNNAGSLQRDHIRVGTLGGERGTGVGRAEWERKYYRDILDQ